MSKRESVSGYVNQILDIPADISLQLPRIVLTGDRSLFLENHRGVLHFSQTQVRVAYRGGQLTVAGEELCLPLLKPDELEVAGLIRSLHFEPL